MTPADAYAELVRRAKEVSLLQSCAAVLGWDQQTYMPKAAVPLRGDQLALLASLAHEKATDPRIGELLAAVQDALPRLPPGLGHPADQRHDVLRQLGEDRLHLGGGGPRLVLVE